MSYAKELLEQLKKAGKEMIDEATGRQVADMINNHLLVAKSLTPLYKRHDEPKIVLDALTVYNQVQATGISEEELTKLLQHYVQHGIKN